MSYSKVVDKLEVDSSAIPIAFKVSASQPIRIDLPDIGDSRDSFTVESLFTMGECQYLIDSAEKAGMDFWDPSSVSTHPFRRAYTLESNHQPLADLIWERVKDLVVPKVHISESDEHRHEIDIVGDWVPCGINPKILFSRYRDGGHFAPHTDGCTIVDLNQRSLFSCVIYLNSCQVGGQTKLYDSAQADCKLQPDAEGRLTGQPELVLHSVDPERGRMLVFYHTQIHEGFPASCKYIIRTDVMYRRETPICDSPDDREAYAIYLEAQGAADRGMFEEALPLFKKAFKLSPSISKLYKMG